MLKISLNFKSLSALVIYYHLANQGTRKHPFGMVQVFCTSQNTEFVIGDNSEFKRILFANAEYRPLFCVKKCTQNQYSTGWNTYTYFCTQILVCGPFLIDTFPEWESDLMSKKGKRCDVTVISSFTEYLVLMEKKRFVLILQP